MVVNCCCTFWAVCPASTNGIPLQGTAKDKDEPSFLANFGLVSRVGLRYARVIGQQRLDALTAASSDERAFSVCRVISFVQAQNTKGIQRL